MCIGVLTWACMCGGQKLISCYFLYLSSPYFFFETFSHWTWSMPFWLATRALKILLSLSPPTRDKDACLAFYVGAECPNSGSHSLVDRTLLTETFPYMWKIYIYISIHIYNPGRNVYLSMYICMHIFPYIFWIFDHFIPYIGIDLLMLLIINSDIEKHCHTQMRIYA